MNKKHLLILLFFVILFVLFVLYNSQNLRREYKKYIKQGFELNVGKARDILTFEDIRHLPKPVQKYLIYVGVLGKEKIQDVKVVADGEMKVSHKLSWAKANFEQNNFFGSHLTRLFYIKVNMFGVPIVGLHSYTDKSANMKIKIAGLIPVADVEGKEMRISDTVTLLNDMCIFAPASLIDKRIQWELMDDHTAKAIFKTNHCTVSAVLYFNDQGELVNFTSDDRYYLEEDGSGSVRKVKWSTPIRDYKERNGLRVASYVEAVWNMPEGDYCYFKANIRQINFNYLNCLGEAQKFSIWKALFNSILAGLAVIIPVAILVGAGYLGYHYGLGK